MDSAYKYRLQTYKEGGKKICPQCGKKTFVPYIDSAGQIIDTSCGRCDREDKCGYHYTPREFFRDHEWMVEKSVPTYIKPQPQPKAPTIFDTISPAYLQKSLHLKESLEVSCEPLFQYLQKFFPFDTACEVWNLYYVGISKQNKVIWWQIDTNGKIHTGKVMAYLENGHRDKKQHPSWVHSLLGLKDFNLSQCLFGEHLLSVFPNKRVGLVEAEKTAVICAMEYPDNVWLSVGGKKNLSEEKISILKNRSVRVFPDCGGVQEWRQKIDTIKRKYPTFDISVFDTESIATDTEIKDGADIADVILREKKEESRYSPQLEAIISQYPSFGYLVDSLQLEEVK